MSQQAGVQCFEDMPMIGQANLLIQETLESANRIDDEASAELDRLAAAVANTDLDKALNEIQQSASENQLELMREALPIGEDSWTVAAWWNSLTPEQQAEFERAVPVELYDLNGIPGDVKKRMEGSGGYNRIEMIRWAQQNVNNKDIDIFDNNCANFVSHALEHAGLDEKGTFTLQEDSWGRGLQTGWDWWDSNNHSHSRSWTSSDAQRNFFLKHGGQEILVGQAQPGDVIYWEQAGTNGPVDPGKVHHAAVVTSVMPDGNIHYTQHTSLTSLFDSSDAAVEGNKGWKSSASFAACRRAWEGRLNQLVDQTRQAGQDLVDSAGRVAAADAEAASRLTNVLHDLGE